MTRPPIPYDVAVRVYFRDGWLCSHCRRPTIFHLALKLLGEKVTRALPGIPVAYWDERWRRDQSPLLDQLAASVDHIEAFSTGGAHTEDNFATICVKCNVRKGTRTREEHAVIDSPRLVKGKHGEPTAWDGLASTFVVLARESQRPLTPIEKGWLRAMESWYDAQLANARAAD
jgi:5-methylcytosine-specific restriction endonuclease McrA